MKMKHEIRPESTSDARTESALKRFISSDLEIDERKLNYDFEWLKSRPSQPLLETTDIVRLLCNEVRKLREDLDSIKMGNRPLR